MIPWEWSKKWWLRVKWGHELPKMPVRFYSAKRWVHECRQPTIPLQSLRCSLHPREEARGLQPGCPGYGGPDVQRGSQLPADWQTFTGESRFRDELGQGTGRSGAKWSVEIASINFGLNHKLLILKLEGQILDFGLFISISNPKSSNFSLVSKWHIANNHSTCISMDSYMLRWVENGALAILDSLPVLLSARYVLRWCTPPRWSLTPQINLLNPKERRDHSFWS